MFFGLRFLFELGFGACDYDWETHWDTLSFLACEHMVDGSFARNTVGADLTQENTEIIPRDHNTSTPVSGIPVSSPAVVTGTNSD